ncbi:MAG: DMT family transporter [Thermomicrobia bacterium]|nr:DMT family transporter [Thermomicrobia bacterium]
MKIAGAGRTAVLGATAPLFALPLSMLVLGERPGLRAVMGTLLTVVGIALVVWS